MKPGFFARILEKKSTAQLAILGGLGIAGLFAASFAASNSPQFAAAADAHDQSVPFFATLDNFVIFGTDGVSLDDSTQVSSGDLGTNNTLDIGKSVTVNGNLFADKVTIDDGTSINGNATLNRLKSSSSGQILGTQTNTISLPVGSLTPFANFTVGTQDVAVTDTSTILPAGNYHSVTVASSSTLTLSGGTYNFSSLTLSDGAKLVFTAPTTLNIQSKLKGDDHVSIIPGVGAHPGMMET